MPSTSPPDETPTLPRIFLARCDRYDNLYLHPQSKSASEPGAVFALIASGDAQLLSLFQQFA